MKAWILGFALFPLLLFGGPLAAMALGLVDLDNDWRTASRASAGIAPDPATTREPVIQVYGARAFGWRGAFAVHTWVALKRRDAPSFTVYEVIGWHQHHGGEILTSGRGAPDRLWYGATPEVYADVRGAEAEALIGRVEAAIRAYPFRDSYRTWPGPNSNTFTAHVARAVPELGVDLPPTAIGKDYLGAGTFAAPSPSGSGYQVSLFGLLGVLAAAEEGLEVNVLGLSFGVDPLDLAVKLPGLGRLPRADGRPGLEDGPAS